MFKNFLFKQLIKKQLRDLPKDKQAIMMAAIERNPELFQRVAASMQAKMKEGKNQMQAAMEAAAEHKDALRRALE